MRAQLLLMLLVTGLQTSAACTPAALQLRPVEEKCKAAGPSQPRWWHDTVGYEIFVRSFADADADGVGDFEGMRSRLDHLKYLGVDLVWLMPIAESPSYHGYDVTNYDAVEPDYGTEAQLRAFLAAARLSGIRVITDLVLNHTSVKHPWFRAVLADPKSPMRERFVFSPTDPGWSQPWGSNRTWHPTPAGDFYYGLFWSGMPDLNFGSKAVRDEMLAVAKRWLDRGVDGFRLDAIRYLVETGGGAGQADTQQTLDYLTRFADETRNHAPERYLVGEVWADTSTVAPYLQRLDSAFDFDMANGWVAGANGQDAALVRNVLCQSATSLPAGRFAAFLTNHDQKRVASQVPRPESRELLAFALLTGPGMPWLYYGEEVGMLNGPSNHDRDKRLKMPWKVVEQQRAQPRSLLSRYRRFIQLRKRFTALRRGGMRVLMLGGDDAVVLLREGPEVLFVGWNLSESAVDVELPVAGTSGLKAHELSPGSTMTGMTLRLAPFGYALVEAR